MNTKVLFFFRSRLVCFKVLHEVTPPLNPDGRGALKTLSKDALFSRKSRGGIDGFHPCTHSCRMSQETGVGKERTQKEGSGANMQLQAVNIQKLAFAKTIL